MNSTTVNRGETTAIPFTITDAASGLAGKRVTFALARDLLGSRILTKVSGMGVSSADVSITGIAAGQITGTINLAPADTKNLAAGVYFGTLWVDDGAGTERCVSPGGYDQVVVNDDIART